MQSGEKEAPTEDAPTLWVAFSGRHCPMHRISEPDADGWCVYLLEWPPLIEGAPERLMSVRAKPGRCNLCPSAYCQPAHEVHQTMTLTPHNADFLMAMNLSRGDRNELASIYAYALTVSRSLELEAPLLRVQAMLGRDALGDSVRALGIRISLEADADPGKRAARIRTMRNAAKGCDACSIETLFFICESCGNIGSVWTCRTPRCPRGGRDSAPDRRRARGGRPSRRPRCPCIRWFRRERCTT